MPIYFYNNTCSHTASWKLFWMSRKFSMQLHVIYKIHDVHYGDVTMGAIASQITSLTIVYSIVYSDADQRKHQSSASLAFVRGIHQRSVNSPHKWPVTRKMFPFDDVILCCKLSINTPQTPALVIAARKWNYVEMQDSAFSPSNNFRSLGQTWTTSRDFSSFTGLMQSLCARSW